VASEFPISGQLFSTTYGCGATERRSCLIFAFWPIFPIQNPYYVPSSDQPTAQGLHRRMILIFSCGSRRSKGVPSGTGVFLRLLLGELGTPKLAQISHTANGYTHTKCYYTARQIWTKDVWKRAVRRTDVLFHQISSPLPQNSPKNLFWGTFQCRTYYTETPPSVAR